MRFILTVEMDGAAFHVESNDEHYGEPYQAPELRKLLGFVVDDLRDATALADGDEGSVRDTNGNTVLRWVVVDE